MRRRRTTEHPFPTASIALCASALVLLGACSPTEPQRVPPALQMIPFQSDPFAVHGIRPDPDAPDEAGSQSGAILIEWSSLDPAVIARDQVGAYRIYRSDSIDDRGNPLAFEAIAEVPITVVGADTLYADTSALLDVGYHYLVRSVSRSDGTVEGPPSDTVAFTLTTRPLPVGPSGPISIDADHPLAFRFSPPEAAGLVAVSLDEVRDDDDRVVVRQVWRRVARADFSNPRIDYDGDPLIQGRRYRWSIRKIFSEGQPLGNASRWTTFTVL